MTIEFRCDCGELFQVEDEFAGRKGRCPTCKRIMLVPEKEPEPLELHDEIHEEEEVLEPGPAPAMGIPEPLQEPLPGRRVEEEVEVLRGWDGPEPDLGRVERPISPRPMSPWRGLPRPLLLGLPAAIAGILILILLLRPSGQRSEHPALERAPGPTRTEMAPALTEPQAQSAQKPAPQPASEPSKPETPPAQPSVAPPPSEKEKQPSAKTSQSTPGRAEERKSSPTSTSSGATAPTRESALPKETKPKEPTAKPQATAASRAPSPSAENYTVNVGAFKSQGMADAYAEVLRKRGLDPFVWSTELTKGQGKMYRVSIGRFPTKRQADLYAKELKEKHGLNTYVAKKPGS